MGYGFFPDDNEIKNLFTTSVFSDPSLVQFIHRNLAYLIFIYYLFILIKIYKSKIFKLFFAIYLLGFLLILQIFLGILTLVYGAHIIIASLHQVNSIFLVSSSIYFLFLNKKIN